MLGILLIDKPIGISSHDAVNAIRRQLGTKRVGHAGTLDPLASGLLIVAVGPATRFLQYLPLEPKEYEAQVVFGRSTATYDKEGEVVAEREVPPNLREAIEAALPSLTGLIRQVPPMHSAAKVGGKPLYRYARAGIEVERRERTVHVKSIELAQVHGDVADLRVSCSGGTYIRTLANDLGEAIGCGAHLAGLKRVRVGKFQLADAVPLQLAKAERMLGLREAIPPTPIVEVSSEDVRAIREGRAIEMAHASGSGLVALAEPAGQVFSMARLSGNRAQPECVIPSERERASY